MTMATSCHGLSLEEQQCDSTFPTQVSSLTGDRALVSLRGPVQTSSLSTMTGLLRSTFYIRVRAGFKGKKPHQLFIDFAFLVAKENPKIYLWIMETMKVFLPPFRRCSL